MANQHSTLTGLFSDIADAIREKDGSSASIVADAFPTAIRAIPSGGGGDDIAASILDGTISEYTNSTVTTIRAHAFYDCIHLQSVSTPNCSQVEAYAFSGCTNLKSANFSLINIVNEGVFLKCTYLSEINMPNVVTVGNYAFNNCTSSLKNVSLAKCSYISTTAFMQCYKLETISFPVCKRIDDGAFSECSKLTDVYLPECSKIGSSAFNRCQNLSLISLPKCGEIRNGAFASCIMLQNVSLPICSKIYASAFFNCATLVSLYLTGSSVCTLSSTTAFSSTPIAGYTTSTGGVYGSIYVPASLLTTYQSATNWTYFSSRFVGI